ncbi:hypothetical protein OJ967_12240 [Peribacillus frigoritolerans]|uniref:hypothetical protein n=1 Tax=Peribacillus frigoritolerans TaxID=450367 RepID=UPI002225D72D|nr:hypothetical protein [Peribacillus frigoritolerans]UYZ01192.1 hypothetical protein OJ967_12240 [Peribacillus frigoritolerans]
MLRINELDNAIDYLEKASFHYNNREDKYWFKWLTISLHGALYGFGVCAVQGSSASLRVLKTPGKKKINEFLSSLGALYLTPDDPYPNDHLAVLADEHALALMQRLAESDLNGIGTILTKCEDPAFMMQNTESKVLKKTEIQNKAIEKLKKYRDDFAHFKPKGLTIITETEDWMIDEVVEVIRFLALESNNVTYYNLDYKLKVEKLIGTFKITKVK